MKNLIRMMLTVACVCGLSFGAVAQDYPSRPITLVVAAAPGGSTDYMARLIAREMGTALGKQVVVENRAGASGNVGTDYVAKSAKDGYTLLFGYGAPLATNVSLYGSVLPYDPVRDFIPITLVAEAPEFLMVHPSVPANNLNDLLKLIRDQPGKYSFASGGTGTVMHLAGELLKLRAKLEFVHVPYKGEGPALTDVTGGHVPVMFGTAASLPIVRSGKLRALAVTTLQRSQQAPTVPTFAESGFPGFDISAWYAILAPAGTPRPIVEKLQSVVVKIIDSKSVSDDFIAHGLVPLGGGPEKLAEKIKTEISLMAELVKTAGLKPGQ